MKIEVLISTMHQKNMDIFSLMNIKTDALAVNQCDYEYIQESKKDGDNTHRMISLNERGLSRSRNTAIFNSSADICVIADDDLVYKDDYPQVINEAYEKYPDADVIAFSVPSTNALRPTKFLRDGNVNALQSMKLSSFQLTFKRERVIEKNISFDTLFGAGSLFTCGEENIFLIECLKKGLKIKYSGSEIAVVNHRESTWYEGFNELYFKTKGAMFYRMSKAFWMPLIIQFAIRKHMLYKSSVSFVTAVKYMFQGKSRYRVIALKGRN